MQLFEGDAAAHAAFRARMLHDHLATRHHRRLYLAALRRTLHRRYAGSEVMTHLGPGDTGLGR